MSKYITIFNSQLNKFLDNLEDRFPKERDITILKTAVELAIKTRPEYIIKVYYNFVQPYRQQIEDEDEEYFINEDLSHIINNTDNANEAIKKIEYIKDLLASKQIPKKDKESIWTYLKLLNRILDKIIDSKEFDL